MNEKDLINNLVEVDKVLAKCKNPALEREEHDAIRNVMQVALARIQLSYKQEKELKELKKDKEE